jgi:hypothetical protein
MTDKVQSINFLKKNSKTEAEKKRIFLFRFVSIIALISYCVIAGGIFFYSFSQENKLLEVEKNLEKQTQNLKRLEKTESLYILFKQRLSFLSPILFEKRSSTFKNDFDYFNSLLVDGVEITDSFWDSSGVFSFSGKASDGLILSNYLDRLSAEVEVDVLDSVNLLSATRKKEGDYTFELEIDLKDKLL